MQNDKYSDDEVFFTDAQLRRRWQCSQMKLWRMRKKGVLEQAIKIGGTGANLTRDSAVKKIEGGADASAS